MGRPKVSQSTIRNKVRAINKAREVKSEGTAKKKVVLSETCLDTMRKALGDEELTQMVATLVEQAKDGDVRSFEAISKLFFGGGKVDLRDVEAPSILARRK